MNEKELLDTIHRTVREKATRLNLSGKHLSALPPEIGQLTKLTELYLGGNQLTGLPPEIGQLTNLTKLDLSGNQLTALPAEIGQLTNLTELEVTGNQLTALPAEIGQLTNLTELEVSFNELTALPPEIGQLTNLGGLAVWNNQLTALPAEIGQLTNLSVLFIEDNELTALRPQIGQLTGLTELYLEGNQLTRVPPEIGELTDLTRLYLARNQLTALPPEIGQLTNLTVLDLRGNPLPIPPEVLAKAEEPAVIINYWLEHQAAEKRPLNEAKMLLVGQGSVGKTSLVNRLVEDRFDPHEDKTEGIDIRPWQVEVDGEEIRLNVWDFGGQEIMHATHQFFLTKRSLYLLVLDARLSEEENRVEYWLKIIQSFGGDSPVIVVGNKTDQQPLDVDRRGLQSKYPSIKAFADTSCKTGEGIEELRSAVARQVGDLEHIHDQLLETWFGVKTRLERMQQDYIPYTEYEAMCRAEGVSEGRSQQTLIGFLHDLGIVLNFRDDPRLQETNILNPEWVTNGVYRILNWHELFQSHGVLERDALGRILDCGEYPREKHLFVMDMMRKFELCFDFEGLANQRFLVPDLLPKQEPYTGGWDDALAFEYHYNVLPGSVISRFIVRMHAHVHRETYWRNGVVLAEGGNTALVKADREDAKVFVRVAGPQPTRRAFFGAIRAELEEIHRTISRLEADPKVPLPDHPEIVVDYQHLLDLEEMGEETFVPSGLRQRIPVKQLLDGVVPEYERRQRREGRMGEEFEPRPPRPPEPLVPPAPPTRAPQSPWRSGSFYLVAWVVLTVVLAAVGAWISWYAVPLVVIGSLLGIGVIGACQLRQDEKLSEKGFVELMVESYKRLALLKGDGPEP